MKRVSRRGKSLSLQDTTDDVKVANESIKKDATELVKTPDEQQKEQEQKFFEDAGFDYNTVEEMSAVEKKNLLNVLLESKKSEDTLKKDKPLITNVKKGDGKTKDTVVELDNKESVDIEVQITSPTQVPVADGISNNPDEDHEVTGDTPSEEAVCASFLDGTVSDAVGRCQSPAASSSNESSVDYGFSDNVDPSKIVTDEMLEEEKRLQTKGEKEEEKRLKDTETLLNEMTEEDTEEKRYQRLKYLLTKSTLYTEYLVGRMKKQKEDEEKRKNRNTKIKQKKAEEKRKMLDSKQDGTSEAPSSQSTSTRSGKRKSENESLSQKKRTKTSENSQKSSQESASSSSSQIEENMDQEDKKIIDAEAQKSDEPELLEKAATFGVVADDEGTDSRIINGEAVPFLQPLLMTGGVLRNYQIEGYSWLKVLYENGVNGILADEMGLGKTVQCVAIISHLVYMGIPGPFLVCAPLSTIPNWYSEFQRFSPKVPVVFYHGNREKRQHLVQKIRRRHEIRPGVKVQPVVITSYEVAMMDRSKLAHYDWKYLIVDEGHRIKNSHCRLIRDLRMYRSTHRLLLTGTPLQNSLSELWSLLNFLLPEIFDDLGSFQSWFDVRVMGNAESDEQIVKQEQGNNILSMLHAILAPFMLRRLKTDVELNIPPKKEVLVFAPLTALQKEYYEALVNKTIFQLIEKKNATVDEPAVELTNTGRPKRRSSKKVDYSLLMESDADTKRNENDDAIAKHKKKRRWNKVDEEESELDNWIQSIQDLNSSSSEETKKQKTSQVTIKFANVMMQLRKCCNHPYLLEHPLDPETGDLVLNDGVMKNAGKMLVLDMMLKALKERGHKVLIFSQMTRMLDLIEDFCEIQQYDFCRLDGKTNIDDRRDSMKTFNDVDSGKFVFLLSTRAGGLGINLVGADTVIIYDSDWNPQCDLQAQDRCHRIGQVKPVVVYRFVTANTIDQKIIERAAAKRKLEKMVIHKGKFKTGNLLTKSKPISPEELRDLLKSKDYEKEFTMSEEMLESLLDRSDLYEKWNQSKCSNEVTPSSPPKKSPKSPRSNKVIDTQEDESEICE